MEIAFVDANGRKMGRRKAPVPPRRHEIVMLPPPFPDGGETAAMDAATFKDPIAYEVQHVIWDILAQKATLVVRETSLPPGLR